MRRRDVLIGGAIFGCLAAASTTVAVRTVGRPRVAALADAGADRGAIEQAARLAGISVIDPQTLPIDAVWLPSSPFASDRPAIAERLALLRAGRMVIGAEPMGGMVMPTCKRISPIACLHYALSLPASLVAVRCDDDGMVALLAVAARSFRPLDAETLTTLRRYAG